MKKAHEYNRTRGPDERTGSDEKAEAWMQEVAMPRRTFWGRLKSHRWLLEAVLILMIFLSTVQERHVSRREELTPQLAGDISGFAPTFSQQIVSFHPDPVFAPEDPVQFWSKETQDAWLGIVPAGMGYINVKDPSQYKDLPHPIHDYANHTVYTTSVTNQLQCIYSIIEVYNLQRLALESNLSRPKPISWPINRCFDYLRQAIMCAGDVTLEGAETTFVPPHRGGSDGWDAKHVCRDYKQVYAHLEHETINPVKWMASVINV